MSWKKVGSWIKENAGTGAALVGSLLTGNVPGAVAAGVSLVSGATGTNDPSEALATLQTDPASLVRLKELAYENEADIRRHIESMERLKLEEHHEVQTTIREGDKADDEYVRRTRPRMARNSWNATVAYCLGSWVFMAFTGENLFDVYLAGFLSAPAWGYIGFRTGDKFAQALGTAKRGGKA